MEGLSAAAARRAIIGDIRPLLADNLSMRDAAGVGDEVATVSPEPETAWEGALAEGAGLVFAELVAIKLVELAGSGVETRLGMIGK